MGDPVAKADVKASGDAAVVPPPPPPADKPAEKPKDEKKAAAPAAPAPVPSPDAPLPTVDLEFANIQLNLIYGGASAGNKARDPHSDDPESNIDPHTGAGFLAKLCYPRINMTSGGAISGCPTLTYSFQDVSTGNLVTKGPEVKSNFKINKLGLGWDFSFAPTSWLDFYLGGNLGLMILNSKAPEDGESGTEGTFVGDGSKSLPLKVSLGETLFSPGLDFGVRFPAINVAGFLTMAPQIGFNYDYASAGVRPDWASEADRSINVPIHRFVGTFGGSFDIGPTTVKYDRGYKVGQAEKAPTPPPAPAKTEEKKPEAPPAAPVPESVKAVQGLVDPVKVDVKTGLDKKAGENTAANLKVVSDQNDIVKSSDSPKKAKDDARGVAQDAAKAAMKTSDEAAKDYQAALNKQAEAEAKLAELKKDTNLKPDQVKLAEDAVAAIKTEVEKLGKDAHTAWENATKAVSTYNGITGVAKKDQLTFKSADPATFKGVAPKVEPAPNGKKDEKKDEKKEDKPNIK